MSAHPTLTDAISKFGAAAKETLDNPAVTGQPEDQLRTPLVALLLAASAVAPSLFAQDKPSSGPTSTVVYIGGNDLVIKSSDGKLLNYRNAQDPDVMRRFLLDALDAWRDIPPPKRAKGAVKVPELNNIDHRFAPELPAGGLIVNVYTRILDPTPGGFFCHGSCKFPGGQRAAHDHLWFTEAEWQALIPRDAKKGQEIAIPARLVTFEQPPPARVF